VGTSLWAQNSKYQIPNTNFKQSLFSGGKQLAENVGQDAAVIDVFRLHEDVHAQRKRRLARRAVAAVDGERHVLPRGDAAGEPGHVERFGAVDAERLDAVGSLEFAGKHAHPDEIGAMDALEAPRDHGAHAQQVRALGRPVARRAHAVVLARENDEWNALRAVAYGGIEYGELFAERLEHRVAALGAGHHQVAYTDVREGAACHDLVIATPHAEVTEGRGRCAVRLQPVAGGRCRPDAGDGADVIRGNGVAENGERTSAGDVARSFRLAREALEEGRLLDEGRPGIPGVDRACGYGDRVPELPRARKIAVFALEIFRVRGKFQCRGDLRLDRPELLQVHGAAF